MVRTVGRGGGGVFENMIHDLEPINKAKINVIIF